MQFELRKLMRWSTTMKYDSYFATQYKDCFIFFGIPAGSSVAKVDGQPCTMGGCVATLVEVDRKDGYIWSPMPHLTLQLSKPGDDTAGSVEILGGYAYGEEIKLFGIVDKPKQTGHFRGSKMTYKNDYTTKCWNTSLTIPFSCWSKSTSIEFVPEAKISPQYLVAVQKCKQYIIHFYSPEKYCKKDNSLIARLLNQYTVSLSEDVLVVTDDEKKQSCLFSTDSVTFDGHVSSAVVGDDLFILSGDKMAKVEKFTHLLVASAANTDQSTQFTISFDLTVPHTNSTLFVVQDTLCVVGGCDDNHEPFSDIYQFDQSTQEWNECGVSSVSRYAASVVTFTDRKHKEAVFIAGGFKGKDIPCSIIEILTISS